MKISWSNLASNTLKDIFKYHKEIAGEIIAHKIKTKIFNSTKHLLKHTDSGPIEESLKQLEQDHRYLVSGNYKIVYRKIKEGILITDIFDTRQDPLKINDPKR